MLGMRIETSVFPFLGAAFPRKQSKTENHLGKGKDQI